MANGIIDALTSYGCDTQTALERFMRKEDLYVKFLNKFLEDRSYAESAAAIAIKDHDTSLTAVHTLKGVAGNLGFSQLYDVAADMVFKYRAGEPDEADAEFGKLTKLYDEVCDIIRNN